MNIENNPDFELNNNLEFLRTPVKHFVKFEYKKLQTFVAAMGLPSNLKRKQLLAIIVAKKMGKDNMIPAILKEVTRQRNQRKKLVRDVIDNHNKIKYTNRLLPPKFAPLPSQVITDKATQFVPLPQYTQLEYQPCFGFNNSGRPFENTSNVNQEKYYKSKDEKNPNETFTSVNYIEATPDISYYNQASTIYKPETVTYEYYYDTYITKKYYTKTTDTTTTTRGILHMSPATSTTPWYHQPLSIAEEFKSSYDSRNMPSPNFSQTAGQVAGNGNNVQEDIIDMTLKDCNIDEILDYVMGDEKDQSNNRTSESTANDETSEINSEQDSNDATLCNIDCDSDLSNSIQEMYLLYYALLASRALWPLKRYPFTHGKISSFIFDCLSPINSDTKTCFSPFFSPIPHPFETYSIFKPKACIYSNSYALHNPPQSSSQNVPDRCLLQPENSLSFGVPQMYYRSRNYCNEYNPSYALSNYLYHASLQDMSKFAFAAPQADYNIVLPNEKAVENKSQPNSSKNYIDLKPRPKKPEKTFDVEATIPQLSAEEETLAYNSLEDINAININIQDPSRHIHQVEHECQCLTTKIACPFMHSLCNWFENIPLMAKHIREMHNEKVVSKKSAEYYINFVQLEMLKNKGVKIVQEYKNRLCYISLNYYNDFIFITIQELCESIEQHNDKIKARLYLKHPGGNRSWIGQVSSMIFPLSHLWKQDLALTVPSQYLKCFQSKHFKLQVDIEI